MREASLCFLSASYWKNQSFEKITKKQKKESPYYQGVGVAVTFEDF